jgi:hypothetical protein
MKFVGIRAGQPNRRIARLAVLELFALRSSRALLRGRRRGRSIRPTAPQQALHGSHQIEPVRSSYNAALPVLHLDHLLRVGLSGCLDLNRTSAPLFGSRIVATHVTLAIFVPFAVAGIALDVSATVCAGRRYKGNSTVLRLSVFLILKFLI